MSDPALPTATNKSFLNLAQAVQLGPWRVTLGVVLLTLTAIGAQVVAVIAFVLLGSKIGGWEAQTGLVTVKEALLAALVLVVGFGVPLCALLLWCRFLEKRGFSSLLTARRAFSWRLALSAFVVASLLSLGLSFAFDPTLGEAFQSRLSAFGAGDWVLLACIYGVGIIIQAGFEEVAVRGWFMQSLARLGLKPLFIIPISAVLFSAMHLGHPGWATLVIALILGLFLGWSVWRLNGLEAALGIHIANNFFSALLAGAMMAGNQKTLSATDHAVYGLYLLGLVVFVELWARVLDRPARA